MAELFNITHDANNLNEYDSTVTDGGDLSTGAPGLAGTTARMEAFIDDTNDIHGNVTEAWPASNQIRFRFYIDPNTLTMADGDEFVVVLLLPGILYVYFGRTDAAGYQIRVYAIDDETNWDKSTGWKNITDAEHYIEVHLIRESGDGNDDGELHLWIDGNLQASVLTVDNWTRAPTMSAVQMGAFLDIEATTSDTLYLDELKANDDGGAIGPVAVAVRIPRYGFTNFQVPGVV